MTVRFWRTVAGLFMLTVFACGSVGETPTKTPADSGADAFHSEMIAFAEEAIRQCMRRHHIPGMAVALVEDRSAVLLAGYGMADRENEIPATKDTAYSAYSLAKLFTAIEIMRLHEEGLLELDAPIADVLPDFHIKDPFAQNGSAQNEAVTIRRLLSHRARLPRNSSYHGSLREAGSDALRLQVESLSRAFLAYPPAKRYKYSNVGFNVLGRVVEILRREDFVGYMDRDLLQPLGMSNSSFLSDRLPDRTKLAMGYEFHRGKYCPRPFYDHIQIASGNLFTTAADMAEFMLAILRSTAGGRASVISGDSLEEMFVPRYATADDPQKNGLGWMISHEALSELMIWHQGGDVNANAVVALLPQSGYGISLLTNSGSFEGSVLVQLAIDILGEIAGEKAALSVSTGTAKWQSPPDMETLEQFSGRYVVFGEVMRVYRRNDRLKASIGPATLSLHPADSEEFAPSHWLYSLGLKRLFPVDLSLVRFQFQRSEPESGKQIIARISDIHYEVCEPYPPYEKSWDRIVGTYDGCVVTSEKEVLRMSPFGILKEVREDIFTIMGGPFCGDIVLFDPRTHTLMHQGITYRRI